MQRINTRSQVAATGWVRIDAGDGVQIEVPTGLAARLAVIEYDSGWRNVSAGLLFGATGTLHIRRTGMAVHWRIKDFTPGTGHAFYLPPAGMVAPSTDNFRYPPQAPIPLLFYLDINGRLCRPSNAGPLPSAGRWFEGSYLLPPGTAPVATPPGDAAAT